MDKFRSIAFSSVITGSFLLVCSHSLAQAPTASDALGRLDSLKFPDTNKYLGAADSISFKELKKIEASAQKLNRQIDSLQSLNLPTEKYKRKLDSLTLKLKERLNISKADSLKLSLETKIVRVAKVQDSLKTEIDKRVQTVQSAIDKRTSFLDSLQIGDDPLGVSKTVDSPLSNVNTQLPGLKGELPQSKLDVSGLPSAGDVNLPSVKTSQIENPLNRVNEKVNELQAAPGKMLSESEIGGKVTDIKGQMQKVTNVTGKAEEYVEEVKTISEDGLAKSKMIPEELERQATNRAMKLDEVKELQKQDQQVKIAKNMIEEYKEMALAMQDKDKAKDLAKSMAKEMPDPFLNQKEKLKAGVAQLDKLKKKYGTIPDSRYLPKRVPNPMKEKSFRERVVPGMSLQAFKTSTFSMDFAPYISYKLTKRFRPGVGFDYRVMFDKEKPFVHPDEVYGYRAFNDFKMYGNFYLHTEGEWLHYSDSASAKYSFPGDDFPSWRFRLNIGLFRTYKISKRLDGQVQLLYNVLDMKFFPTAKNASLRFGVEYKFKARKKE